MSQYKIYSYPNNPRVWKAQIAGKYNGVEIDTPAFQMGTDNKTPAFLEKNPNGKVPTLETPDGCIWESNAIARYIARQGSAKVYSGSLYDQALIDQWIDFSVGEIELPSAAWLYPIIGIVPFHKEATNKAKTDIKKALNLLNNYLIPRTFLVGERVSLADIVVSMSLYRLYKMVFDPGFRKAFPNVTRWYLTCVNQPEFKSVIGEVELCEKMMEAAQTAEAPKKEEPAAKKPEAKPAAAASAGGDDEEKPVKKAPNPLDSLPPSKLVMDEWKRTYSNTKNIKGEAMPWFWEHYDPEGYCLYKMDYKYNDELNMMFTTNNFVSGFIQRLDPLRKYGFGSVLIFGDEDAKKFEVSGVWLFRGKTIPAEMSECEQSEQFTFTQLDHNNQADRDLIADYWAWEGNFQGKKFLDNGKVFK